MNPNRWFTGTLVVGLLSFLVLWTWFGYLPLAKRLKLSETALSAKTKELARQGYLLAHVEDMQARAAKIQLEWSRLQNQVPREPKVAELLRDITRSATECNIHEFQFSPLPLRPKGGYAVLPVRLSVICSAPALQLFLKRLNALPRLVVPRAVQIVGRDKTGKTESISVQLTLVTYVQSTP